MNLKTGLLSAFTALITLLLISVGLFLGILEGQKKLYEGEIQRRTLHNLANELRLTSQDLTHMAKNFITTGHPRYKRYFQKIRDMRRGKTDRPYNYYEINWHHIFSTEHFPVLKMAPTPLIDMIKGGNFTEMELNLLKKSELQARKLADFEYRAIHMPNKSLVYKMLHGKKHNQMTLAVTSPLLKALSLLEKRTHKMADIHQNAKNRLIMILLVSICLSVILVLVSTYLVILHFQKKKDSTTKDTSIYSTIKSSFRNNWPLMTASLLTILFIVTSSWWFLNKTEILAQSELKQRLEFDLDTTYGSVVDWIEQTKIEASFLSKMIDRYISQKSFQEIQRGVFKDFHRELKNSGILTSNFFQRYIVTNAKGTVVSSDLKNLMGKPLRFSPDLQKRIENSNGQLISFPHTDKSSLWPQKRYIIRSSKLKKNYGMIHFLISPKKGLHHIFQRGFAGASGEIYMVNDLGQFISESRWAEKVGQHQGSNSTIIGMKVVQGLHNPKAPLTLAVKELVQGKSSTQVNKYNNYLGKTVMGLWRWNKRHRFGIVSEIEREEAFSLLTTYGHFTVTGSGFTICLIISLSFFFIRARTEIAQVSMELSNTYNTIKKQNEKLAEEINIGQKVQMDMLPDVIKGKNFTLGPIWYPPNPSRGISTTLLLSGKTRAKFTFVSAMSRAKELPHPFLCRCPRSPSVKLSTRRLNSVLWSLKSTASYRPTTSPVCLSPWWSVSST